MSFCGFQIQETSYHHDTQRTNWDYEEGHANVVSTIHLGIAGVWRHYEWCSHASVASQGAPWTGIWSSGK